MTARIALAPVAPRRLTHRASAAVIAVLSLVLWAGILAAVP